MRHLIFHNFWLKAFSIALATVIWLAIHYGIQNDTTPSQTIMNHLLAHKWISVPVSVIQRPADRRSYKVTPATVSVSVTGEDMDVQTASDAGLRVFVDLTDFPSNRVMVAELRSEAPPGITVREIRPPSVTVEEQK